MLSVAIKTFSLEVCYAENV